MERKRKCPECKGMGYFALSKERILADPRHTHIRCPRCNGIGKVKGKWKWKPLAISILIIFGSFGVTTTTSLAVIDLSVWSIHQRVALGCIGIVALFGFWKAWKELF